VLFRSGATTALSKLKDDSINLSLKSILLAENQKPIMDSSGIHLYEVNNGVYSDEQLHLTKNCILFTDSNLQNAKTAIGKIRFNDVDYYGVNTQLFVGDIVATSYLTVRSGTSSGGVANFTMDGSGVNIFNAPINMNNGTTKVSLDPNYGFAIGDTSLISGGTVDPTHSYFYINSSGKLVTKGIIQAEDFVTNSGVSMLDSFGKWKRDYLDLGNIQLDGTTGDITTTGNVTLGGNINITGNIIWSSSNSPVTVQYSVNGSTSWHSTFNSADMFARYSYDGGATWTSAIRIQGVNGINGSDASVTRGNIVLAMLSANPNDGIYSYNLSGTNVIGINATAIKAGSIQGIDIYGGSYHNIGGSHRLQMGNTLDPYGVFRLYNPYYGTVPYFSIYDDTYGGIAMYTAGEAFMQVSNTGYTITTSPYGVWDFQYATVTGITATAVFA
jgi:hypothetical protein